jgi:hypothetical protein
MSKVERLRKVMKELWVPQNQKLLQFRAEIASRHLFRLCAGIFVNQRTMQVRLLSYYG